MPTILDTLTIQTCTVSYGKEASFAGKLANVAITVTPKALGINQLRLVWAATGDIFSSFTDSTTGGSGAPGIIVLPQTGQTGFRHGTSTFQDWYYEAVVTANLDDGQQLSRTYRFQIPAGQTTLDLDMLDEDGIVTAMPAVAPIAAEPAGLSAATQASLSATYQPLAMLPLQTSLPTGTVAVTADADVDNLWPGWYNAGQSVYTDISAMTDPAAFGPYFYGGHPYRDTWWSGGAAIYNQLNSGTNSTWALAVRIAGSTRLLVGMNGATGALTASQFVIEIDGQKLSRRYVDAGIVYDGHQTGLLLTFPDTRGHDIRIWSKAGFKLVAVDAGGTVTPVPAPFGGKKRLVIAGDSWTEGTAQAGPAVSLAAMLQLAADWDVSYLGNGGTGYVATGPSYASPFGSSQRLTAMESFAPDLWVFLGSINDGENAASAVQTAAAAAYSALATALPNAKGIVVGPQLPGHPLVSAALAAAAGAAPNVLAYIDPAAQNWTTPAGVTGPTDGSHPSAIGTEHVAAHLIAAIRAVTVAHGDTSW